MVNNQIAGPGGAGVEVLTLQSYSLYPLLIMPTVKMMPIPMLMSILIMMSMPMVTSIVIYVISQFWPRGTFGFLQKLQKTQRAFFRFLSLKLELCLGE